MPIVFFGTLEIAWCAESDVILFRDGLEQGLWNKCKNKSFYKAMQQVRLRTSMLVRFTCFWAAPRHISLQGCS